MSRSPASRGGRLERPLEGPVAADADRSGVHDDELAVEAVAAGDGVVLGAGPEEVRVDPVRQDGQLARGDALSPEVAGEAVADDGDPVGQPVDPALERLGEPDPDGIPQDPGFDGQVRVDVLDVDEDAGPAEDRGEERRDAQLEGRRAQEQEVAAADGQQVDQGPDRVDVPGQETPERMRRARRPESLHGETAGFAPGIEEAPELLSPLPGHGRHDLDLVPGLGQGTGQLVHEDRGAAEVGQVVHRVQEDLHGSGTGFSRAH